MKHLPGFVLTALAAGALSLSITSCGDDDDDTGGGIDAGTSGMVTSGTYYHYVTNSVKIGANASEADGYGFALDNLPPTRDNLIGKTLANFGSQLMIDSEIDAALKMGSFIILHSVRADDLASDSTVSWQVYLGDAKTSPDFSGNGSFTIKSNAPTNGIVTGSITGGKFTANPGNITLEISLSATSAPLSVDLKSARIEGNITATTCSGKIGGAIKVEDLKNNIIPFLATQLDARITADAGCKANINDCDNTSKLLLGVFDIGVGASHTGANDRNITKEELLENDAVKGILSPDVDVLKADGSLGTDGTAESVSIGLGFTCVKGTFTASTEH